MLFDFLGGGVDVDPGWSLVIFPENTYLKCFLLCFTRTEIQNQLPECVCVCVFACKKDEVK